ncbi:MAG: phosphoglycerate dehydrogenase [Arachnia sp.]
MRYRIQTLNQISPAGLSRLPADNFDVGHDLADPDALLLRSADLHSTLIGASVKAVVRAGAGTNNIPIDRLTERGIPVFNTPGANANAVKELVLAGALLSARGLFHAGVFVRDLPGGDEEISVAVESGKKQFVGIELPGRTMGVIGLGAIGVLVANAALSLGMRVVGYDPAITVEHAWRLSAEVERAASVDEVVRQADFLTVHVPLIEATRHLISTARLALMKPTATVLNFARAGIIDEAAIIEALDEGRIRGYVCDFPSTTLNRHPKVMALPHLGASTVEAEENCAAMAADQVKDFLLHGNVRNSVNFPEAHLPRNGGARLVIINANVPNMVGQVSSALADAGLNIADLLNKSRGDLAITLVDVDGEVPDSLCLRLREIEGVLSVRVA